MKRNNLRRLMTPLICAIVCIANTLQLSAMEIPESPTTDIIYIYDASGSVDSTDPAGYMKDALRLGADLAPNQSRIGIISVSDRVLSEYPLTDMTDSEERSSVKEYISSLHTNGSTDFLPGLERAAEMLKGSSAENKWIILMADFQEGGYNLAASADQKATAVGNFVSQISAQGIQVHSLFFEPAPANSVTAAPYTAMPEATGGTLHQVENPNQLPAVIEQLYFNTFPYFQRIYALRGTSSQTLQVPMPTDYAQRARVYISAANPPDAFDAVYAGAILNGDTTKSYAIVDVDSPTREGVAVTVTPGPTGTANVYLLLEYDIALAVTPHHETDMNVQKEPIQTTTMQVEIVDSQTGMPLLREHPADQYTITITRPDGQPLTEYERKSDGTYTFSLTSEEDFGAYQVQAVLATGDFSFSPPAVTVQVEDIRPLIQPLNWPLYIAIGIAFLLILGAVLIAFRHKKKEAEYQGAVEMSSDYRFHGKLSVYAVMLEGGNREIRPFDFRLHTIPDKRITLRSILDSIGEKTVYEGAENILFLVGPEESIVVRNNSKAAIRVMGRNYEYRTSTQLFYGQKCYIIFEKDENEVEVKYSRVKVEDPAPVHFNIQSHRMHSQNN